MAVAINLRADNVSADEIERLWDQFAAFEDQPSMRALAYRPHLTFAIYDSPQIEEKIAWKAMLCATERATQLSLAFRRIRWFAGPSLILWAEPEANETLGRWHASISSAINPVHCRPHYRPGAWTPHCTLGTRITNERNQDAIAFAKSFDRRIEVTFDVVDCVIFPPVRIVAQQELPKGAP